MRSFVGLLQAHLVIKPGFHVDNVIIILRLRAIIQTFTLLWNIWWVNYRRIRAPWCSWVWLHSFTVIDNIQIKPFCSNPFKSIFLFFLILIFASLRVFNFVNDTKWFQNIRNIIETSRLRFKAQIIFDGPSEVFLVHILVASKKLCHLFDG